MLSLAQIPRIIGSIALSAATVSGGTTAIANYPRDTPAYSAFLQCLRVVPLADHSLRLSTSLAPQRRSQESPLPSCAPTER